MLEDENPSSHAPAQRILPDGCAELIFNLGEPFEAQSNPGTWQPQPKLFLAGQITGPLLVRPTGKTKIIGVRLRPYAVHEGFRLPAEELTGTFTPLEFVLPKICILDQLGGAKTRQEAIALLDATLQHVVANEAKRKGIVAAAELMIEADGDIAIETVAEVIGISRRQLERRFKKEIGLSPKQFCRILRFQKVFSSLEENNPAWPDVAAACGYYDQAHLIRDCRELSGETPAALLSAETDLAEHFLKSGKVSHSYKTHKLTRS
jgi:AraC-like DNA-binding protein